jgi:hypothetical protein
VYSGQLSVLQWRPHFLLCLLLAVIISACVSCGESATVNQVGIGSTTLSWTPPTQNLDGSPLTDLAGYKMYYGNEPGNYHTSIRIDNPGITIYVVENLTPNIYYFVLTAINSSGVESQISNEVSKLVL